MCVIVVWCRSVLYSCHCVCGGGVVVGGGVDVDVDVAVDYDAAVGVDNGAHVGVVWCGCVLLVCVDVVA